MKRVEDPCRIVGLTTGEVRMQLGSTGEMSLKSTSVLQDKDGNVHGHTDFVGPWPKPVIDAANELRERIEEYLVTIHFDAGDTVTSSTTAPGESRHPTGLGLFGTGKTESQH